MFCCDLFGAQVGAGAAVSIDAMFSFRLAAFGFELVLRAETPIRLVLVEQLLDVLVVEGFALSLAVGTEVAALQESFVPIQAQPANVVEHRVDVLLGRPFEIGVVEAHDERPTFVPGIQVVENRGPGIADVNVPGRARCVAYSDHRYLPTDSYIFYGHGPKMQ